MTDITELAQRLKLEVHRAVSNFNPQMNIKTRDLKELVEALEKAQKRISQLESRTVTFKLPVTPEPSAYSPWVAKAFYQFHRDTVKSCFAVFSDACAAAGIKAEAE
ncbi:Uncharacterised protein [Klebsiella pneumoniae]|uniref:hypothetical protein n=1 Tax=Klebsiella pneumoniae complex TaxID=3390273 RepID=UPI0009BA9400|nr:hypothetical protein [Klebsiella pneumoniae]SLR43148.1 Uncharacterised protein [Klebsiella pneumoniae]